VANQQRLHLPATVLRVLQAGQDIDAADFMWPYEPPRHVWAPADLEDHPLIAALVQRDREWRRKVLVDIQARRVGWDAPNASAAESRRTAEDTAYVEGP
jgi:hypothetical protein